jgi:hypothetical protein
MTSQKFRTFRRDIARGALRNASPKNERATTMKTIKKISGMKVKANVKAGGLKTDNHNRSALRVRSNIKAGTPVRLTNHNRRLLVLV